MSRSEVMEKVNEIFCNVFDDDDLIVQDETNAEDIEDWDSLEQVNLIVNMEKEFKVKFNLEEVNQLKNVGEMVDMICSKIVE